MTESKCQHCQQDVVYGTTEHGYRGFVHTANGTTECPASVRPEATLKVQGSELARALGNALVFAAKTGARPLLASVNLRSVAGELRIEATDSYALYRETMPCEGDDFEVIIERRDLEPVVKALKGNLAMVPVTFDGRDVTIGTAGATFTVRHYDCADWMNTSQLVDGLTSGALDHYALGAVMLAKIAKVAPEVKRSKATTGETVRFDLPETELKPCKVTWPANGSILVLSMPIRLS